MYDHLRRRVRWIFFLLFVYMNHAGRPTPRFKPSADEKSCIATAKNEQKSELDCGADAGKVGFLSADPVKGCICETEKKDTFCGGV
jgi:hypothetical protein